MNKSKSTAQWLGQRVRLVPPARRSGVAVDDDWLVVRVSDESVTLEHAPTKSVAVVGFDGIQSYQSDQDRCTSTERCGFLLLHVQVNIGPDGKASVTPLPPPRAAAVGRSIVASTDTQTQAGPRLVVEQCRVNTPGKLFGGDETNRVVVRLVSYAMVTVKNDPLVAGPEGLAKNVTAHVVFSNDLGHYLTVEAEWDKEKQTEPVPDVLDNFFGGGPSVWFNVGQRRTIIVAFKMVDDDAAYAVRIQPHVKELEVRAPGLRLPEGQYHVGIEVRSHTSDVREDFTFTLRNNGQGSPLELSGVSDMRG